MTTIPLVEENTMAHGVKEAKQELQRLREKKKLTKDDKLIIEYLKTFIGNPTPMNYILLSCGRADEMRRKEEEDV